MRFVIITLSIVFIFCGYASAEGNKLLTNETFFKLASLRNTPKAMGEVSKIANLNKKFFPINFPIKKNSLHKNSVQKKAIRKGITSSKGSKKYLTLSEVRRNLAYKYGGKDGAVLRLYSSNDIPANHPFNR